jgi:hypothetical protein
MVYNAPTTIYYKAAQKLATYIAPLMEQLRLKVSALPQSGVLRLDTELDEMFDE